MKSKIASLIIPIIVVLSIFMVSKISMENYDIRFLKSKKETVTVTAKEIKPAGTTFRMMQIGSTFKSMPVSHPEEPTLFIDFAGDNPSVVVGKEEYRQIEIGEKIGVTFFEPKYWGAAFAFQIQPNSL